MASLLNKVRFVVECPIQQAISHVETKPLFPGTSTLGAQGHHTAFVALFLYTTNLLIQMITEKNLLLCTSLCSPLHVRIYCQVTTQAGALDI